MNIQFVWKCSLFSTLYCAFYIMILYSSPLLRYVMVEGTMTSEIEGEMLMKKRVPSSWLVFLSSFFTFHQTKIITRVSGYISVCIASFYMVHKINHIG